MKQTNKLQYKDYTFDSVGEMHFYWWCEELKEAGFIDSIELQPKSFELSGAVSILYTKPMKKKEDKTLEKKILNPHSYTADGLIRFNSSAEGLFYMDPNKMQEKEKTDLLICNLDSSLYVEVKPIFDQNNMTRLAVLNQKWVMDKFRIFINIVIPEKLFDRTFTPKKYLLTDVSKKERKIKYKNVRNLEEFLKMKHGK